MPSSPNGEGNTRERGHSCPRKGGDATTRVSLFPTAKDTSEWMQNDKEAMLTVACSERQP